MTLWPDLATASTGGRIDRTDGRPGVLSRQPRDVRYDVKRPHLLRREMDSDPKRRGGLQPG
jgi:hypothetical protein